MLLHEELKLKAGQVKTEIRCHAGTPRELYATRYWPEGSSLPTGLHHNSCPVAKHQREARRTGNHSKASELPLGLAVASCRPKAVLV